MTTKFRTLPRRRPPDGPRAVRAFPARHEQVAAARRFVAERLAGFTALDDAVLCASEVVTNAIVHGTPDDVAPGTQITVDVRWSRPERVYVSVTDPGARSSGWSGEPQMEAPSSLADSCRGLLMVNAIADAWGAVPVASGGHRVWFELVAG